TFSSDAEPGWDGSQGAGWMTFPAGRDRRNMPSFRRAFGVPPLTMCQSSCVCVQTRSVAVVYHPVRWCPGTTEITRKDRSSVMPAHSRPGAAVPGPRPIPVTASLPPRLEADAISAAQDAFIGAALVGPTVSVALTLAALAAATAYGAPLTLALTAI